jgi:heat shock protein HslJ
MIRASRTALLALLVVAAVTMVGCGGRPSSFALDGTEWRLAEWSVGSASATDFEITLTFDDGVVGGQAPVNSYGGPYDARSDGTFRTDSISSTLMAGEERANSAETAYLSLLRQVKRYSIDGDKLILSGAGDNQLLVFERR